MDEIIIPDEVITNKIYFIRDTKIMLDRDLADLYVVSPRRLREQVARNSNKFPSHFMFQLNEIEVDLMVRKMRYLQDKFWRFITLCIYRTWNIAII